MNLLELLGVSLIALAAAIGVLAGTIAALDAMDDTARQAMCNEYRMDFEANTACYQNSQQCLLSGADYRSQVRAKEYLEENCPNEWETVQGATQNAPTQEANPGVPVGPETQAGRLWSGALNVSTAQEPTDELVPDAQAPGR